MLASCTSTPKLEGKFIKVKENSRGSSLNFLNFNLVKEVTFGDNMCRFDYVGTTQSGRYTIDGNYIYIEVGGELGTLAMEIIDNETLEGEGWISGTFKQESSLPAEDLADIELKKKEAEKSKARDRKETEESQRKAARDAIKNAF